MITNCQYRRQATQSQTSQNERKVINIYFDSYGTREREKELTQSRCDIYRFGSWYRCRFEPFFNIFDGKYCSHEILGNDVNMLWRFLGKALARQVLRSDWISAPTTELQSHIKVCFFLSLSSKQVLGGKNYNFSHETSAYEYSTFNFVQIYDLLGLILTIKHQRKVLVLLLLPLSDIMKWTRKKIFMSRELELCFVRCRGEEQSEGDIMSKPRKVNDCQLESVI